MKTYSSRPTEKTLFSVACPGCGNEGSVSVLKCDGFGFVRCLDCSLMYQNPQPSQNDLFSRYSVEYFDYEFENEDNFFGLIKLALADVHFDQYTAGFDGEAKSVVDIGCATGKLIHYLSSLGWSAKGVEICEPSATYGIRERGVDIHIGTLGDARLPDKSYGVVHSSHLIEHLTDPGGFISESRRILRDDGFFVVTTPNVAGFQARLLKDQWRSAIADHIVLFTRQTLRRLLDEHRFDIVESKTWGGIAEGLAPKPIKRIVDTLAKRFGFGDVMIMLARKR